MSRKSSILIACLIMVFGIVASVAIIKVANVQNDADAEMTTAEVVPTPADTQSVAENTVEAPEVKEPVVDEPDTEDPDITMPGMDSEINYNDTPEGKAEMERLGFDEDDNVQLRPDVFSITPEELRAYRENIKEMDSPYHVDNSLTLDESRIDVNMAWAAVYQQMFYLAGQSLIIQYCNDTGMDPYSFTCEVGQEAYKLNDEIWVYDFYNDTVTMTVAADYDSDTGEVIGCVISVKER